MREETSSTLPGQAIEQSSRDRSEKCMSSQISTVSYLKGLSILASHGFDTVNSAVDAILQLMVEQLGMRSSFLAHFKRGSRQLEVVAVHNLPGGCDIQVGTAVPLSQNFPSSKAERPASLVLEKLQPPADLSLERAPAHGNG